MAESEFDRGKRIERERILELIKKDLKETEEINKNQFRNEELIKCGYHSKIWDVPKWLLTETRIGVLLELKKQIQGK